MKQSRLILLVLCLAVFWCGPVCCQEVYKIHTHLELISEVEAIHPGQPFWVALRIVTDPHWHTYWRNPGDSGTPTDIEWQLPKGFQASELYWPFPEKIEQGGIVSYGYARPVLLLARITPPEILSAKDLQFKARVAWLACEVPCLPGDAQLSITLPVAPDIRVEYSQWKGEFDKFRRQIPRPYDEWDLEAYQDQNSLVLKMLSDGKHEVSSAYFFPYNPMQILSSGSQRLRSVKNDGMQLRMAKDLRGGPNNIERLKGVLVVELQGQQEVLAIDVDTPVNPLGVEKGVSGSLWVTVFIMLAFAFAGGVILNVMPCVFPVLSIKVLHYVNQSRTRRELWRNAFGYAAGVIAAFLLLSLLLVVLRAGGAQLGWGFQFQSPVFVVVMTLLFFIIALNLFGVFEFVLPGGIAVSSGSSEGWKASFSSGIFAVIVATPCTAPFMGTALGFALTQPIYLSIAIFFFLGLGMAAPFVLLLLWPGLIDRLPRPGPWMQYFKRSLGFIMLFPVIWLLWVLSAQRGEGTLISILTGLLVLSCGLWIWENVKTTGQTARERKIFAVILIMIGLVLPFTVVNSTSGKATFNDHESGGWHNYNEQQLAQWAQQGRLVFLDFSARWCLTCQANEKVTLQNPSVIRQFDQLGVIRVKADWTNKDPLITKALARFGRASVPTYVLLYGSPDYREYEVLPELLTPAIVKDRLNKINTIHKEERS